MAQVYPHNLSIIKPFNRFNWLHELSSNFKHHLMAKSWLGKALVLESNFKVGFCISPIFKNKKNSLERNCDRV